ncbi:MAG: hypothetical protein CMB21_07725 [Euryarchaeota archaeon]|nr:hypothetical protein [Euryarchaeota archaeon]
MHENSVKTFLVTGGSGFIGQHLVNKLVSNGHHVIVVDNHLTSVPGASSSSVRLIEKNISDLDIDDLPPLDGIYHLASIAAPRLFREHPMMVIHPNVHGTELMTKLAELNDCRLVYTSSSETYGSAGDSTFLQSMKETHPALHILLSDKSPYSSAKVLGEEIIRAAFEGGVDACAIRLFNVYGSNMDPTLQGRGRVIPNFQNALMNGHSIPIEGDGSQSRTFTWIEDAIDALIEIMKFENQLPVVMNLGSEETVTILELANMMAKILDVKPEFEYSNRLSGDPDWRRPDCSLLRNTIGWAPNTSIEIGLQKLLQVNEEINT